MNAPTPNPIPHRDPIAVDEFAHAVASRLTTAGATYQHGPMGGHEWRWSTAAGVWALTVGGAIDAGPLVIGPAGNRWHLAEYTLQHADLVVLMLQLAGALPSLADQRPGSPGRLLPVGQPIAMNAGQRYAPRAGDQGEPIAGSDLPARGTGAYPRLTRPPRPRPHPTQDGAGPEPWAAAFDQEPPWNGAFRTGDDQGDAGDQGGTGG